MAAEILRYINQIFLSKCLKGRRNNPPEDTTAAKKAWRRTNKQDIRKACYKQQYGLCAYTELSLDNTDLGCHLEHIAPRSSYPERTFLPKNIILSIMGEVQSGNLKPCDQFAGHHKSEMYSDDWFISPFDEDCASYFKYSSSGLVEISSNLDVDRQMKATKTIEVLNLNATYLVESRKVSLQLLNNKIETLLAKHSLIDGKAKHDLSRLERVALLELPEFIKDTLAPQDKKLPEFYSAKKQLLDSFDLTNKISLNLPQPL